MVQLNKIKNAMVVVTGASRGIGRETARELVQNGYTVLAVARNAKALESLKVECGPDGPKVIPIPLDIAETNAAQKLKKAVNGRRVLALVHNAGVLQNSIMGEHARQDLELLYRINVIAPLEISQALVDELKGDPPGHIVHIGSMGGFQDSSKFPGLVAYSASKAALACMAQCMAEEFKDVGIRSNCLALGAVDTDMLRAAFPGFQAPITAAAMGRYISWFALEGHNYYNGKVLPVAVTTP